VEYNLEWVGLLLIRDRKILTTREKDKELFQLPGGGKEQNETDIETLMREISEELQVKIIYPVKLTEFILPGRHENFMIKFIIYTGDISEEISKGKEIAELKWVNSKYADEGIDIGNPLKMVLIRDLLEKDLVD
jgi:8-oxo-dGTP pyrophosphatase MutT (NUDIX family)